MLHRDRVITFLLLLVGCAPASRAPQAKQPVADSAGATACTQDVVLRFMEPEPAGDAASQAQPAPERRRWIEVEDPARLQALRQMATNEPACFARALYAEAWRLAPPDTPARPTLFIALEPAGNHVRQGFELVTAAGEVSAFPALPYLVLDEDEDTFRITLLHETGHAIHGLLRAGGQAGGAGDSEHDPGAETTAVAPIPHSTAAITDRRTAFYEGLAIHLETINAHCGRDPRTAAFYGRQALAYGSAAGLGAAYYGPVRDLLTYAQRFARYHMVRDGLYAFEVAPRSGDYVRVQLDPARDLRTLRDPGSLMSSEGMVASFFFHLMAGSACAPLDDTFAHRYGPVLAAIRHAEIEPSELDPVPLVEVVAALLAQDRALGERAIDVFLDLTRGVTMDQDARTLWTRLFDVGLHLDVPALKPLMAEIDARRAAWKREALADPRALARRVGPVVVMQVPAVQVGIALFGDSQPLAFDINAAGAPMLRLVPGLGEEHIAALLAERARKPFASAADFRARMALHGVPADALVLPAP